MRNLPEAQQARLAVFVGAGLAIVLGMAFLLPHNKAEAPIAETPTLAVGGVGDTLPDDKKIETTALRQKELASLLAGTEIEAVVGVGLLAEDQIKASVDLRGRAFTPNEYRQYKNELIVKVRERQTIAFEEKNDWIAALNRDCPDRTYKNLVNITKEDLVDLINNCL